MPQELLKFARSIEVTDYLDYRVFLKALFDAAKKSLPRYSYMSFAEDLGFSRSNVLWLVVSGRRMLSLKAAERISEALNIRHEARRYFLLLVRYNNARKAHVREALFQDIVASKSRTLGSAGTQATLEYFGEWYYPVIREMAALEDFRSDPEWITKQLHGKIMPRQAERSLALLTKLGLLKFDEVLGRHVQTVGEVRPDDELGSVAAVRYHQKMLEIASDSLTLVPEERRDFNVLTVCVDEVTAGKIRTVLIEACEKIMALELTAKAKTSVYQINADMFALTRSAAQGGDDEEESSHGDVAS